jgi:hypothetical protein
VAADGQEVCHILAPQTQLGLPKPLPVQTAENASITSEPMFNMSLDAAVESVSVSCGPWYCCRWCPPISHTISPQRAMQKLVTNGMMQCCLTRAVSAFCSTSQYQQQ